MDVDFIDETIEKDFVTVQSDVDFIEETIDLEFVKAGPQGPPGEQKTITRTAVANISALNVVGVNASHEVMPVTWDDIDMANKIVGIALVAGSSGDDIEILSQGHLQDSYFDFDAGRVYVGPSSMPTQTVPPNGKLLQSIGVSTDTDTLLLDLSIPLIRN